MIFLRVMLKPLLILFGFFIGMQLVYVMGWWVDETLWDTLDMTYDSGIGNPFSLIGMLVIYTGLMLAIVHKSFEMTTELDNWVFEWIGGQGRQMGENQLSQTHVMGAVAGVKQQMSSLGSTAGHGMAKGGGKGGNQADQMADRIASRLASRGGSGGGTDTNIDQRAVASGGSGKGSYG